MRLSEVDEAARVAFELAARLERARAHVTVGVYDAAVRELSAADAMAAELPRLVQAGIRAVHDAEAGRRRPERQVQGEDGFTLIRRGKVEGG